VKLYKKGELMVTKNEPVNELCFIYAGVAHLYGQMKCEGQLMRYKIVTLKKGSWFGDF
jgi:signal-transduction protein with cAMP-binding, CBS, and nucleotidyltransferase domain